MCHIPEMSWAQGPQSVKWQLRFGEWIQAVMFPHFGSVMKTQGPLKLPVASLNMQLLHGQL